MYHNIDIKMQEERKEKNWFRIFSPAILAIIFCCIVLIDSAVTFNSSGGWSMIGVIVFMPILFAIVASTLVSRWIAKNNTILLWVIELVLILAVLFFLYPAEL